MSGGIIASGGSTKNHKHTDEENEGGSESAIWSLVN